MYPGRFSDPSPIYCWWKRTNNYLPYPQTRTRDLEHNSTVSYSPIYSSHIYNMYTYTPIYPYLKPCILLTNLTLFLSYTYLRSISEWSILELINTCHIQTRTRTSDIEHSSTIFTILYIVTYLLTSLDYFLI